MSVRSSTIIYTTYFITCDVCGRKEDTSSYYDLHIHNSRDAVRSIGWSFGRGGVIKCDKCRTQFTSPSGFIL